MASMKCLAFRGIVALVAMAIGYSRGRVSSSNINTCFSGSIIIIIIECSKLSQKEYKTKQDWVEKVIRRELCKKFKFDHTNEWYIHNPESVLENEIYKIVWDFEIQLHNLILARRPDLEIVKKKTPKNNKKQKQKQNKKNKKKNKNKNKNLLNSGLCRPG